MARITWEMRWGKHVIMITCLCLVKMINWPKRLIPFRWRMNLWIRLCREGRVIIRVWGIGAMRKVRVCRRRYILRWLRSPDRKIKSLIDLKRSNLFRTSSFRLRHNRHWQLKVILVMRGKSILLLDAILDILRNLACLREFSLLLRIRLVRRSIRCLRSFRCRSCNNWRV